MKAVKTAVSKSARDLEAHLVREMASRLAHIEAKMEKKLDAILIRMGGVGSESQHHSVVARSQRGR